MSKKDFLNSLTEVQRNYVEFLLDNAYAVGYSDGKLDADVANKYDNW